ncbi:MAG TPA: carotenoid biosynthesis protein, partial [Ferruginibacter sp.]|nr:carotenoid biosynthesis protein [Ferruginibacter sp.]
AFFVQATVYNLLLMFLLLIWTQRDKNIYFIIFLLVTFTVGMGAEIIGVNTNALFGEYSYGKVLWYKYQKVPLIIGVNWIIIIYCCGISIHTLLVKAINRIASETKTKPIALKAISIIADGAILAVFFDWIMEPVAVKLGFWQWADDGNVPLYNYLSWLMVSNVLLAVFHFCPFNKQNKFAVNLLLIQMMFFLLLRTFLTR